MPETGWLRVRVDEYQQQKQYEAGSVEGDQRAVVVATGFTGAGTDKLIEQVAHDRGVLAESSQTLCQHRSVVSSGWGCR